MSGPDIVIPTEALTTCDADGYTKIRISNEKFGSITPKSLITLVKEQCEQGGESLIAFKVKRGGEWVSWTFAEYYRDIECAARAFVKLGLEERHSVCILGFNSPEWFLSNIGCIFAGGMVSKINYSKRAILYLCTPKFIHVCITVLL